MLFTNPLLFFVIATTTASPEISEYLKPSSGRRDVNFTLETIFEINQNDDTDVRALENAKNLIDSVKRTFLHNTIEQHKNNSETEVFNNMTFSDFCQKVIAVLYRYDDTDLEDFAKITRDEIKNYHYRGGKFHELAENKKFRKYFDHLQGINKGKSAGNIKIILNAVDTALRDKNLDLNTSGFINAINDLYKPGSVVKFKKFLRNIEDYRQKVKRNMDLVKIIRSGIRSIIFDHYKDLSDEERSQFTSKLGDFFNYYKGMSRAAVQMHTGKNKSMRFKTIKRIATERKWKANRTRRPTVTPLNKFNEMKNLDLQHYPDESYENIKKSTTMKQKYKKKKPSKHQTEKAMGFKTPQKSLKVQYSDTDNMIYDSKPPKSSNKPVIEVITMRPYVSKRVMTSQKLRYEIRFKTHDFELKRPKLHLKKPEFEIKIPGSHAGRYRAHISRPNELPDMNAPMFRYNKLMYLNGKIPTNTEESKETEHKQNTRTTVEKFVRSSRQHRTPSNQRFLLPNRKSFQNTSFLNRLDYLENELRIAKTQIKNDSEIIRDLNNIIRVIQKTDHGLNINNSDFLLTGDDNDQTGNKDKKGAEMDLNINLKDFQKLINLKANEILKKLNLVKGDNIYPNEDEKPIIRKFDFDEKEYNKRSKNNIDYKDKKKELSSIHTLRDSTTEYSTKPQRGYLSDGDTYERVEERIYDSDSNNRKPFISDTSNVDKRSNYKNVTKSIDKTILYTNDRDHINRINEGNEQHYDSTLKNDRENKIGKSEQDIISSSGKLRVDEGKTSVTTRNVINNLDSQHTTKIIKSIYYAGNREQRKQKDIDKYFNRANDNLYRVYSSTDLAVDKHEKNRQEESNLNTDVNNFERYTTYSSDSQRNKSVVERNNENSSKTSVKQKRFRVTQAEENLHPFGEEHFRPHAVTAESNKSFKNEKTVSELVAQKPTKSQMVEMVGKTTETQTVAPSEDKVHPKRYAVANLEVEKSNSENDDFITAAITAVPLIPNRRKIGLKKRTF